MNKTEWGYEGIQVITAVTYIEQSQQQGFLWVQNDQTSTRNKEIEQY